MAQVPFDLHRENVTSFKMQKGTSRLGALLLSKYKTSIPHHKITHIGKNMTSIFEINNLLLQKNRECSLLITREKDIAQMDPHSKFSCQEKIWRFLS